MAETLHEKMMRLHTAGSGDKPPKLLAYEVALKAKKQIAIGTYAFTFEKPKGFSFTAGQHVRMTLINPLETDDEGDSRFWSIASTPHDKDLIIALRMRDTAYKRVLSTLPLGSKVRIQIRQHAHAEAFILHEDTSRPAVFLVGGIGIVPAFSMIKDTLTRKLPYTMVLLYANRRPEDAPFLAELENLAQQYPNFTLVPTMTQPEKASKTWSGETGRIDQALLGKYVSDVQAPIYYISGLSDLVAAMKSLLTAEGVKDSDIRAEEYVGFTMNHGKQMLHGSSKSKVAVALIGFAIIVMILFHMLAASSILKAGNGHSLFKNPVTYIVAMLALGGMVMLKVKLLSKFKAFKR